VFHREVSRMIVFFLKVEVEAYDPTVTGEDVAIWLHDAAQDALAYRRESEDVDPLRFAVSSVDAAKDR